jgi:hypothetical protein
MMQKQQAQQMGMMNAMGGEPGQGPPQQGGPPQGPGGSQPNARNVASLGGVEQSGAMGDIGQSPAANNFGGRPTMGGNGQPG